MAANAASKTRLQKFLSDAGVASRRHAEEMILEGRVLVNDEVVDTLPAFIDPRHDRVIVSGMPVRAQRLDYFIIHKPKGVVCTNSDPAGRRRAVDLLPDLTARLFPVGRLDAETTGLLLMTNDGELTQRITHPRYGIPKVYYAEVRGRVAPDLPAKMKAGVYLSEGKAQATDVEILHSGSDCSALQITLSESRNREVRRMLVRLGHPVRKLKRVSIGSLALRGLPVGAARRLSVKELVALRADVEQAERAAAQAPRNRKKKRRPMTARSEKAAAGRKTPATGSRPATGPGRRLIT